MLYYICSPYRGATKEEVEKHIKYARKLTRTVLLHGHSAVAPHLYITNCLNDSKSEERKRGLEASLEILKNAMWYMSDRSSALVKAWRPRLKRLKN